MPPPVPAPGVAGGLSVPEPPPPAAAPAPKDIAGAVEHLFRRESGRLLAILARRLGAAHLQLAEDVVQDALLRAMQVWPFTGVPENPSAWLLQTARNRAFDTLRRRRVLLAKTPALAPLIEDCATEALSAPPPQFEDEIADSQLRMMFVCGQPGLPPEAQVALMLKTLCGFGEREIAAAFLASEEAVVKRLVRARKFLRDSRVAVELPPAAQLAPRVETVLHALYLLFNEGYKASQGDSLLRADLCSEAIRLGELLAAHPLGDRPATRALLALMHLHAARLPARVADDGSLLTLAAQDRTLWDGAQIRRGLSHLNASASGRRVTRYHLEAGIAAAHALAPDYRQTDWPQILELYDSLYALDPTPVVALNRAVALAQASGPDAGLQAVAQIPRRRSLEKYHLLHAVTGQLLLDAGRTREAAAALRQAIALAPQPAERDLLQRRLAACRP
jgi:RNA polymerase sigma factor (sigma-70 family)